MRIVFQITTSVVLFSTLSSWAAEPIQPITRRIPPPGIEIPEKDRKELESKLESIKTRLVLIAV